MSQLKLLSERRFWPLFWTQFCGALNDNVLKNALVILITYRATSVLGLPADQMVSICGGIFILPFFLFSATAGQLADKYEKTQLIRWIKLAEIFIMVLATFGFVYGHIEFLLLVLFLMGLHSTFFGPIKYSILPQILESENLVEGNALIEFGTFVAILIGTIAGGQLIDLPDIGPIAVSVLLGVIALLGWVLSLLIPRAPIADPLLTVQWNPIKPTIEILRLTARDKTVWNSVVGISWFWLFGGAMLSLFPSYCKDVLHTSSNGVTLFLAMFSIGIGVGSMICGYLSRRQLELGLVPFGSIGMTIFTFDLFLIGQPFLTATGSGESISLWAFFTTISGARILIDLFGLASFSGLFIVPLYTLIQERSERNLRSRIIAGNNIVNSLFMVIAALVIAGFLAVGLSIPQIFGTLAIMNLAVAIYIYRLVPEFMLRFVSWILARLIYSLRVAGRQNIPVSGPAVLVCNHVTFVDWLIIFAAIQRPVRFVMYYKYVEQAPLLAWLFRQAKVIPIAGTKEDPVILQQAYEAVARELEDGELVCIFPEGMLTLDGKMNGFRPGIENIIKRTPVPVVPMALQGVWESFFSRNNSNRRLKNFPWLLWMPVRLNIGLPIAAEQVTAPVLQALVTELRGDDVPIDIPL